MSRRNEDCIAQLLRCSKLDVDTQDSYGRTALHSAVAKGREGATMALICKFKANIHGRTHEGQGVIHIAARYDQSHMVYLLLHLIEEYR